MIKPLKCPKSVNSSIIELSIISSELCLKFSLTDLLIALEVSFKEFLPLKKLSLTMHLTHYELALIYFAITPTKNSRSMLQTPFKVTYIRIAVWK